MRWVGFSEAAQKTLLRRAKSPQRLKPQSKQSIYGTAEAVPLTKHEFPQPVKPGSEAEPERAKAEALACLATFSISCERFLDVIVELELMVASVNAFWFVEENGTLRAGERLLR